MYTTKDNGLVYSPSDLIRFMESPFASWMARWAIECPADVPAPDADDPMMSLLQVKGDEHECRLLDEFRASGLNVIDVSKAEDNELATIEAMQSGVDVVFQACLGLAPFKGYADFLVKVPGASSLGNYHYDVWDTKLARSVRPYFMVQLCCYAEMLETLQGVRPEHLVVALGNQEKAQLRTEEYFSFYQNLKHRFLQTQAQFDPEDMPDPAESRSWGNWSGYAENLLLERDHLAQVANITRSQIKKLNKEGIFTMQALIDSHIDRAPGMSTAIFARLKAQSGIQRESEGKDRPLYTVIEHEERARLGLALLPPASPNDVYFDIEGYPLEEGGLEYLWGNTYFDEYGVRQFRDFWAHDRQQEKQAFTAFIDWVYGRSLQDPSMHIYHYASYEITACRKLMGRYGACEHEVDELLRNEVFVDLYKVVKGGLLLGEPRYSIKNVEHLYRPKRETDVADGGASVVAYEQWRSAPDGADWTASKILHSLRDYNIDDCDSTQELTVWLRERQTEHCIHFIDKPEQEEREIPEEVTERTELRDRLLERAEREREANPDQAAFTEHFAWSLEFHQRESKPVFWRLFDRLGMMPEELLDDPDCIADCVRTERAAFLPTPRARNRAYEYRFSPSQEYRPPKGSGFYLVGEDNRKVTLIVEESRLDSGIIVLQAKEEPPSVISLIPDEFVPPRPIPEAIASVARKYEAGSLGECAIIDFLQRRPPRIKGHDSGAIVSAHDSDERMVQTISAVLNLDNSCLTIQGPPGSGKTYTGKHIILELIRRRMRVGISSNSHKAINNLLTGVAHHALGKGIAINVVCTRETDPKLRGLGIKILKNNELSGECVPGCVLGTTAWGFSRDDMEDRLDYLFVDEAGQVAVANLIAMSRSTKNIVLLGDQMQLGQPAQGSHPGESGLSALDYFMQDRATIPNDKGIFLGTTYRMHPAVNEFISRAVYEGRLDADKDNINQVIRVPDGYQGPLNKEAGLVYLPVEHEGNTQASDEEVEAINNLVQELIGREYQNKEGDTQIIGWDDILFVAPYNHQVFRLQNALGPQAKVGSVDKFQGQEAPVVILSMCTSDAGDSPRGVDFVFNKNRINVAISRAQCMAVIVANPGLASTSVSNLEQMGRMNMYCMAAAHGVAPYV